MKRNPTRRQSLWQFIALWLGVVLLSFGLLGGGLLYAVPRLNAKTQHVYFDSRTLDDNHRFELALVAQGRDDLRWHLSGDARSQRHEVLSLREADEREADDALAALQKEADTAPETQLLIRIAKAYSPIRTLALAPSHNTPELQNALDRLLPLVHQHRDLNAQQMTATLRAGGRLDVLIDRWILGLMLLSTMLLLAGSLMLWERVFTPVLNLARTVHRFGSGDLQARTLVLRPDEMGDLCQTFNVMADSMADRERDRLRFVATVAHDLRNPLVVIGGAAHLLKNKEIRLSPEERSEWLGNIEKHTHKLEAIINDLMDGVQTETGQMAFDLQPIDFSVLVREVVEEQAATTQTHLIRHDITALCLVKGDRKRLERVLMNLLSNAIKYSPAGSAVNVSLQTRDNHALCCVRD